MEWKAVSKVSGPRSGTTLLEYLVSRFTYFGSDEWDRQIAEGKLSVNGCATNSLRILLEGDEVAFSPPDADEPEVDSSFGVVMEDEDYLVVDKSGSLPCHPSGRFYRHSLWYILRERYGPVHIDTRLDRETSGLVLVCKNARAARIAQGMHRSGTLEKTYIALVHGLFPKALHASGYLMQDTNSSIRKKRKYVGARPIVDLPGLESCETSFESLGYFVVSSGAISIVKSHPRTGRTHQIRATLSSLGFPVVGDKLYGLDEGIFLRFAKGEIGIEDRVVLSLPYQALHCARLSFANAAGRAMDLRSEPRWDYNLLFR